MMNKQKGNMYIWVTHTWNAIAGKCSHGCIYCFMIRIWNLQKLTGYIFREHYLNDNLGEGNTIFVGDSTDMWANDVPKEWIEKVLKHCRKYPKNTYLFQSKNPSRFFKFIKKLPVNTILGTTLESEAYIDNVSNAPSPFQRFKAMYVLSKNFPTIPLMISIEPIMDFEPEVFIGWIRGIHPKFVSIGADSKHHNLPEPSKEKIEKLIEELKKFTEVKIKDNLNRLRSAMR